jgi:hypothetical protein
VTYARPKNTERAALAVLRGEAHQPEEVTP